MIRSALLFAASVAAFAAALAFQQPEGLHPTVTGDKPAFWKGNLHTHSLWSDGDDFPEMIADWYKSRGYHFLGLSDHNVLSEGERWIDLKTAKADRAVAMAKYQARFGDRWVETRTLDAKDQVRLKPLAEFRGLFEEPNRFLMIPSEEITHKFAKNPVHMNGINVRSVITPIDGPSVEEVVKVNVRQVTDQRKKTGQKMLVFLNHPNFNNGVNAEDMSVDDLRFFEVFNGHPGVKNYGEGVRPGTERMWDIQLALRLGKMKLPLLYGVGTDDAHNYHVMAVGKSNPGRAWIMVRSPFLSPESIVQAMEAGDFYASSGVTLKDLKTDGKKLTVSIQPEAGVTYKVQFVGTRKDTPLDSTPAIDKDGKPVDATRVYHPKIGELFADVAGTEASYALRDDDLYVRARIISTKSHPNPFQKGDVEMAWTQPITK